ncbi:MAG: hypothetical protein KDK66_07115 [Deltaproteobacteria bacterium]|nr:hypothetical protein [Deltaproteobacteria bacterium]
MTGDFLEDFDHPEVEDFFTPGYLADRIEVSQTKGRQAEDALYFGIGKYHGAHKMMWGAQKTLPEEQRIHFSPVKEVLLNSGSDQKDLVSYIREVAEFK